MDQSFFLNAALGITPVLFFLAVLVRFDSFKLVRLSAVLHLIVAGAIAAFVAYLINKTFLSLEYFAVDDYVHFGAPVVEELLKAAIIAILISTNRIGFAFDSAILGFSVGAGFAVIENFYYLHVLVDQPSAVWVIRGFGTAIMHGGTTALFAVMGHVLTVHDERNFAIKYAPGLFIAIAIHATFNFFLAYPVSSTIALVIVAPLALIIFLREDEKSIHDWLTVDFNAHRQMLTDIETGAFERSRAGRFLQRMHDRLGGAVASKMTFYVQLHTELILSAEEVLAAHEKGERIEISDDVKEKLVLLHELEEEIGRTAVLALRPHLNFNRHEFWELYMLEKEAGFKHAHPH